MTCDIYGGQSMATERKITASEDVSEEHRHTTEDEIDTAIARERIAQIEQDPGEIIRGKELDEALAEILE